MAAGAGPIFARFDQCTTISVSANLRVHIKLCQVGMATMGRNDIDRARIVMDKGPSDGHIAMFRNQENSVVGSTTLLERIPVIAGKIWIVPTIRFKRGLIGLQSDDE